MQGNDDFNTDKFLDDDQFYKPLNVSSTNSTVNSQQKPETNLDMTMTSSKLQASEELEPEDNFSE